MQSKANSSSDRLAMASFCPTSGSKGALRVSKGTKQTIGAFIGASVLAEPRALNRTRSYAGATSDSIMKHSARHLRAKAAEFRNTAATERDGLMREVLLTLADGFDEIAKMREKERFAESRQHLGVQIGVADQLWEEQSSHEAGSRQHSSSECS